MQILACLMNLEHLKGVVVFELNLRGSVKFNTPEGIP